MTGTLLSLGHGYSAKALAARLIPLGWTVLGTTRSVEKSQALAQSGVIPVLWEPNAVKSALAQATHLLISAGPNEAGDPSLDLLGEAIEARASQLTWAGYLSTTGVYGDHQGGWVDETTPLAPATKRGRLRVSAESAWQAVPGLPLHIFRLAGIYGPGRGPFAKLRAGTARRIIKRDQVFSRIHVEDIASVLEASIAAPNPGAIYNVCDDDPAPPQDVLTYASSLLGIDPPPEVALEDADLTPMARSFYAESKQVSNRKIKDELGVTLTYTDFRSGLQKVLEEEKA